MIYFDNSATTCPSKGCIDAVTGELLLFANPSSVHTAGWEARKRLEANRAVIAKTLSASADQLIFTASATEADNMALIGAANAKKRRGKTVIITDSEHPAVSQSALKLESDGFKVIRIPTKGGALDLSAIESVCSSGDVILSSLMHVNNETGAVYDVKAANTLIKRLCPEALCHCDCVQSYLKYPVSLQGLCADMISISAHKVCGPKGIAALVLKKGVRILPIIHGGGQESTLRSGTENSPGIAGFAAAATEGFENMEKNKAIVLNLKAIIEDSFKENKLISFNRPPVQSPWIISMQVKGFKSEVLLRMLSDKGIFVSAGSACSSKNKKSPILKAFGLSDAEADCTVRISFSHTNTADECREFTRKLNEIIK